MRPERVERALDAALSGHLCSISQVDAVFGELARRGRRGTVVMRELLEARTDDYVAPASQLESLARRLIHEAGLPAPTVEVDLGDAEGWVGRVDLLFGEGGLVVELDGRRYHASLTDRRADRQRDNRLMAEGYRVLRYSWWDLTERPAECMAEIRRALRRAEAA